MGHFGYTVPEGIVGEVASTVPSIIRTFVASERINFGQLVKMDPFLPEDSKNIVVATTDENLIVGIAIYQPTHPLGYYETGDNVSVLVKGDVNVKGKAAESFKIGDIVYVESNLPVDIGDSEFIFTTSFSAIGSQPSYGTSIDSKVATADNFVQIHFEANHTTFSG